jgi:hypothetical protein
LAKAQCFNTLFANKARVADLNKDSPQIETSVTNPIQSIFFRPKIIGRLLNELNPHKAAGMDEISATVLKNCSPTLCYPFAKLFNLSMKLGQVPKAWKSAKVSPVYKKGSKSDPANYRPVSLLSLVSKVMEKYIAYHIVRHLEVNDIFSKHQFGFRSGHSTLHPLLITHQLAADVLDKQMEARAVALDIAGAFDTVWHKRLLQKAEAAGLRGQLYVWLENYLSNRVQVVAVDGVMSDALDIQAGVPQGSILGPIMFLLYINDLPAVTKSLPLLFADDCTLVQVAKSTSHRLTCWQTLQNDLEAVMEWSHLNQLKFAPHKTQSLLISAKKDKQAPLAHKPLSLEHVSIEEVQSLKLLGVSFSSKGALSEHIMAKAKIAGKLVGMLRRQSCYLNEYARFRIYVSTIRPIMEYGSPVFINAARYALCALDSVQKRAQKLFPTKVLDSLELRRNVSGLTVLYSIVNSTAPVLVRQQIPTPLHLFARSTRLEQQSNLRQLAIPKSRTLCHQKSFMPYFCRLWNTMPTKVVYAESDQEFKKLACNILRTRQICR